MGWTWIVGCVFELERTFVRDIGFYYVFWAVGWAGRCFWVFSEGCRRRGRSRWFFVRAVLCVELVAFFRFFVRFSGVGRGYVRVVV